MPSLPNVRTVQGIATGIWVLRHEWLDANVTVIEGDRGLLVVDTLGSGAAARDLLVDLEKLSSRPVVAVVNTHEHFDHTFGNATLRRAWPDAALVAHEIAAARTVEAGERMQRVYADEEAQAHEVTDPRGPEVIETEILPAETTFSSVSVVDLGDRVVELVHPGRGHTAGDILLRVVDADVVLAGDLLEESAPPVYGDDSFPLEWPAALDMACGLLTADTVVVPGHGAVVGRQFVQDQRGDVGEVAETIRALAMGGVPEAKALEAGDWPFPEETLVKAVRRGYAQLPRAARGLPLA